MTNVTYFSIFRTHAQKEDITLFYSKSTSTHSLMFTRLHFEKIVLHSWSKRQQAWGWHIRCGGRKCKVSQLCKRRVALKQILMVDSVGTKTSRIPKGISFEIRIINIGIKIDFFYFVWLFLYVPSTIFQLNSDGSSWFEPVPSQDKCVLLKDHNAVTPVRLEPAAPRSQVKHSTTEPLLSRIKIEVELNVSKTFAWSCQKGTAWCPSYNKTTTHVPLIDVCTVFKTSHQQLRSYGDWTQALILIRQTGEAGDLTCDPPPRSSATPRQLLNVWGDV